MAQTHTCQKSNQQEMSYVNQTHTNELTVQTHFYCNDGKSKYSLHVHFMRLHNIILFSMTQNIKLCIRVDTCCAMIFCGYFMAVKQTNLKDVSKDELKREKGSTIKGPIKCVCVSNKFSLKVTIKILIFSQALFICSDLFPSLKSQTDIHKCTFA